MVLVSDTLSDESMKRLLTDCFAAGYASRLTDEELIRLVWVWSESSNLTPDQVAQLQELLERYTTMTNTQIRNTVTYVPRQRTAANWRLYRWALIVIGAIAGSVGLFVVGAELAREVLR